MNSLHGLNGPQFVLCALGLALIGALAITVLRWMFRRKERPKPMLGFWHSSPETLEGFMFEERKAREGQNRNF